MPAQLQIANAGPVITQTNYWRSEAARAGFLFLSINARTLRLLVPAPVEHLLTELPAVGAPAELRRGAVDGKPTYELVWLDDPTEPFVVELDQRQCDRQWPRAEDGTLVPLVWYTQQGAEGVRERRRERIQIVAVVAS